MTYKNNEEWLSKAKVHTLVEKKSGRWHVHLVFLDKKYSQNYLVKHINDYPTKKLAEITAYNLKRTVDKDYN